MHEMALAEGVLQVIEEAAAVQGFTRVSAVWLEIGQLAGAEVEALRFCFEVVTRDSVADRARLEIVACAGQGWCLPCAATVPLARLYDACPQCGSHQIQVTGGQQLRVAELQVE